MQSIDLLNWDDMLEADDSIKQSLFYLSGLDYITQPLWQLNSKDLSVPAFFITMSNGLTYGVPSTY